MRIKDFDITAMHPNDICDGVGTEVTVYFDAPVEWLGGYNGKANAAELSVTYMKNDPSDVGDVLLWKIYEDDTTHEAIDFRDVVMDNDVIQTVVDYAQIFTKLISEKHYSFNMAAQLARCVIWKADCDPLKRGPWHFYNMTLSRDEFARAYNREAVCGA